MPIVGERSKFSCLKIYDDTSSSNDDNDGPKLMGGAESGQNKNDRNQKKSSATCKSGGGLIVHSIPQKRKNKGKKTKKTAVVMEGGFIVQDGNGDSMDKKYREDLQQATENNREIASTASANPVQEIASPDLQIEEEPMRMKDEVEMFISEVDSQASILFTKNDGLQKTKEQYLVALYRSKLEETLRQMMLENEIKLKAEAEVTKYKSRYKKLCELLKDAEVNEKTHMAADLEKARMVERELSSQIGELRGELMQARSKIRELEMKCKELASKQQH
ncbi:unnamed protein product [Cercopithifilaria johnstoni]|uniref:Uncharacterized protein n=1 Tax=Cercopithifilaria johnstoni TaxID=2874296 RepID=A0A8J2LR87_9BILA|nr:unnamed protein product [Cercopithifilaria johnstoni]